MTKVTGKMAIAMEAVKALGGKAISKDVLVYLDANKADRADLKTVNSVNATLAYAAKAGLIDKDKVQVGDKMYTAYIVAEDAETEATKAEAEATEAEATEAEDTDTEIEDAE